ncbi:MAG: septal ring lytic transglycosylase RlpA family protein [Frankia sp.]|nr:septal ring lytic transglycosylase RlpA family protein [Frankia sp.]
METAQTSAARTAVGVLLAVVVAPGVALALRHAPADRALDPDLAAVRARVAVAPHASRARRVVTARVVPHLQPMVAGVTYRGVVSWYGPGFHGRRAASGERFDSGQLTAAHRWLPFGTWVRVCREQWCTVVRINDRGPYVGHRMFDLSRAAARELHMIQPGIAYATATVLVPGRAMPVPRVAVAPAATLRRKAVARPPAARSAVGRSGAVPRAAHTSRGARATHAHRTHATATTPVAAHPPLKASDVAVGGFLALLLLAPPASALARRRRAVSLAA